MRSMVYLMVTAEKQSKVISVDAFLVGIVLRRMFSFSFRTIIARRKWKPLNYISMVSAHKLMASVTDHASSPRLSEK